MRKDNDDLGNILLRKVLATTLCRYRAHQSLALEREIDAGWPLTLTCVSIRFKWDEAQQSVRNHDVEGAQQTAYNTSTIRNVLVTSIWFKTSGMEQPCPWCPEMRMLGRTTADTMWKAFATIAPLGPFTDNGLEKCGDRCMWFRA